MGSAYSRVKNAFKAILVMILMLIGFVLCGRNQLKWHNSAGSVWATEYHISYQAKKNLQDSIEAILAQVDKSVSTFNPHSLISAVNSGRTDKVDTIFALLYHTSRQVNQASAGLYDPTVMPLVNAWGFGYKHGQLPTAEAVDSMLQFVGIGKTQLHGRVLRKADPRIMFDFSSIAKGMACDLVGRMLERNGVNNYLVEIGGEVALHGQNQSGNPWHISVDQPRENNLTVDHTTAMVLSMTGGGVATSGNYRNYKVVDGKKISHIINPVTGYSDKSDVLSVTIVAPNCMLADAWATACITMGVKRTQQVLGKNTELGVMLITAGDNGKGYHVWWNDCFGKYVKKVGL